MDPVIALALMLYQERLAATHRKTIVERIIAYRSGSERAPEGIGNFGDFRWLGDIPPAARQPHYAARQCRVEL